ncbi:LysR family transcriptional regulator [Lachnospira pectinoschiza]|uniref:DNA-binding transcriptional regulator, LysR family n=1 Tax=Lachnospira pectinoschiza TaxID=28052 RepID=A0A1G9TH41_9FIRM|nr:LysR family transcriptional regulator [Lachnospira pectinoschiza]SDM46814.1 DNA-binding transcriptional regulator, LysR family [Lachnospira pectinoschiza]
MLDFRVTTFLTVCKYMNYTHAAKELNITQPAVSQHIKFLESSYGVGLFRQEGKKLILTEAGELLFEKMRQLKNDEEKLMKTISSDFNSKGPFFTRDISFGVTMTIGEYAIARPISDYLKENPEANFKIHFANTEELLKNLDDGKIDFALIEGYFPKDKYDYKVYKTVDFIPVASKKHKFSTKVTKISDLFRERLIIREPGSGTRNILERSLSLENFKIADFKHFLQVENMHSIIQLLNLDAGISFLYKAAVEGELKSGKLEEIKLSDFKMKHDFTFIWQKKSIFSEEIEKICDSLM